MPHPVGSEPGPAVAARPPDRPRRLWLVSAVIGALVGAAVSGGIVAALDEDSPSPTTGAPTESTSAAPSSRSTEPGNIGAILAKVEPAVVSISTSGFGADDFTSVTPRQGAGTGVVLTPDGDVL